MKFLILCSLIFVASEAFIVEPWAGVHQRCNDPAFWCKNKETAEECGVLEYCKIEWGKSEPAATETVKASVPIKITLYYESLCGGCREFITSQWFPTYKKLNATGILELELVPYGNAQEYKQGGKWVYYCQHGAGECVGNLIETCAIHHLGKISAWAPFIYCLEHRGPSTTNAMTCAKQLGIDYTAIGQCVEGTEGNQLEHQMALKTQALKPAHQYVPWIVVNGVHTEAIQSDVQTGMLEYVCDNYKGPKPAACNSQRFKRSNVCYKD